METLNENKKYVAIIELLVAILLSIILFPLGIIYILFIQVFIKNQVGYFWFNYIIAIIKQIWFLIMHLFHTIAYELDVLGNVIVGDLIELFITRERDTWFANKSHTISQSIGNLEYNNKINSFGKWLSKILSFILGKNHCINAYITKIK